MKKATLFLWVCIFITTPLSAQMSGQDWEHNKKLSREDHQLMMEKLGITQLRPGPSANPEDPNAANTDESKASPYTSLPDPLVCNNGDTVKTAKQWEKRTVEVREDFDREIYGRVPDNTPAVSWKVRSEKDTLNSSYPVHIKQLIGQVDNSAYPAIKVNIQMILTLPANTTAPVPVIIQFTWNLPKNWRMPSSEGPSWKEQLLEKGWGYAELYPHSIQADNGAGLREGIIGLVNKGQPRQLDDWGALRAWAWGASRALDYFETNEKVDETRVGIAGLSRYGKAALVAMAYEPRLAIGFIGSSGAGGAKILRRVLGEQVENLASWFEYHWFAPNFIKYAGPLTPNDLSVDAHELIALCAPRPLFISCGAPEVEGHWVDARGMFLAGVHAGPVYELLGKMGLRSREYPAPETSLLKGDLAFRQHTGGHTLGPNWPYCIIFAERYFSK